MLIQLLSIVAQLIVALVMCLSVREIRKDRKRGLLEKRLEDFYIPLIKLFGHGTLPRGPEAHRMVEEMIVSKRHLCGRKVAKVLPQHFTAIIGDSEPYFYFSSEYEMKRWEAIADTIWDEYIEVLKECYKIIGVKHYTLPEKPKWMFGVKRL